MTENRSLHRRPRPALPALFSALLLTASLAVVSAATESTAPGETATAAAEWSQFRGPDRSGRSPETGLLRQWPEEGPRVLWRRPLGEGFSGISASGGRLYTLFAEGEEEYAGAFRAADGEELWRTPLGAKFHENFGNGPRATPTVDGGVVYVLGARGRLAALDAATGETRWQLELTERYGIRDPQSLNPMMAREGLQLPLYGYAASPLVEGDLLIVETGARHGRSLVALDKRTGEERWTALDDEIGYASPTALDLGGVRQVLVLPGTAIVAVSPRTGETLWRHDWGINPSQPIFVPPDKIFVSTVHDMGALLLRVVPRDGGFATEEVWRIRRLKNAWNASILDDGRLYGFDNATLRAIEVDSGEMLWAQRGHGQGTLVFADGLLLALGDRGRLALLEPGPEGAVERGSLELLSGRTWTAPTLAGGVLYARDHAEMVAVEVGGNER